MKNYKLRATPADRILSRPLSIRNRLKDRTDSSLRFTGEERLRRRLDKVAAIEKYALQSQVVPTRGGVA